MGFKKGDVLICINAEVSIDMTNVTDKLKIHEHYIVHDIHNASYIAVCLKKTDKIKYYTSFDGRQLHPCLFKTSRFIHEDDWVRRIKYGV